MSAAGERFRLARARPIPNSLGGCAVSTLVPPYHSVRLHYGSKIILRRGAIRRRVRRLWGCVRPAWGSHAVERERKRKSHRRSRTLGYTIRPKHFFGRIAGLARRGRQLRNSAGSAWLAKRRHAVSHRHSLP